VNHDELIAYVDDSTDGLKHEHLFEKLLANTSALRAVVELHKPDESDFPDEWESCIECSGNGYSALYPCNTIKTIEKELT
jgi:hypothetical protein